MAKLSGISIADKNSSFDSGGAFSLQQKCSCNKVIQLDSGWEVELSIGCPYIVVRATGLKEEEVTWATYEAAQEGLDILSANDGTDFSIRNSEKDRMVWWRDKYSRQFLRDTSILNLSFELKISLKTTDEFGNLVEPKTKYHSALRYARLARVTSDLFDAYRNMYLALEFLTSSVSPRKSKERESECNWLKRVLTNPINEYPKFQPLEASDIKEIYTVRCNIFHAKNEGSKFIPDKRKDYLKVKGTLRKLEFAFDVLSASILGFNRENSFRQSLESFEQDVERVFENVDVLICSEKNEFYKKYLNNENPIQNLGRFIHKNIEKRTDICEHNLISYLASFTQEEVGHNTTITGMIWRHIKKDGSQNILSMAELESELIITDIDFFEIHTGMILNQ